MSIYKPEAKPVCHNGDFVLHDDSGFHYVAGVDSDGHLECNGAILTGGQAVAYQIWLSKKMKEGVLNVG